jgi:hypothetical protein
LSLNLSVSLSCFPLSSVHSFNHLGIAEKSFQEWISTVFTNAVQLKDKRLAKYLGRSNGSKTL